MRTFFNKPIREDTTLPIYPDKVSVDYFVEILNDKDAFARNMKNLDKVPEEQYVEEWMETFCSWRDIEQE